jgi:glutamate racemase
MEKECPVPILGVVKPGSRTAARTTRNGKIGVIATQATVNSHSYARHINTLAPQCQVYEIACPRFVPFIEAGLLSGQDVEDAIDEYIGPLLDKDVDTLVLGCTHYPFLAGPISKYAGSAVKLVDPAAETVDELYDILLKQGIQGSNKTSGSQEFYVSGNDESFYKVGRLLLGDVIKAVAKVDLD